MADEFETIILRFRDIVTAEDETIDRHVEVIRTEGYVWWAWWKKGNENAPIGEFAKLGACAKGSPVDVFLVDSGQNKLYKATCTNIEVQLDRFPSPEKEKTPEYYRDQEYCAWFKFTNISPIAEEVVKSKTYVDCQALFPYGSADYSKFNGKKIYSIAELVQQNRTVWFVKQSQDDDPDYEIVLLNAELVQPCNFSTKYYQAKGDIILWLSDLHLADHIFECKRGGLYSSLGVRICKLVDMERIAGLFITGDITSRAQKDGFDEAKNLIRDINNEIPTQVNSENIVMCPGNHDFARESVDLPDGDAPDFIYNHIANAEMFSEFYHSIYNIKPNQYFSSGRKILLSSGHMLEIAALNSLILQQYRNFEGHGYLSQDQLDTVAREMGWDSVDDRNAIRIVMMHHHYMPTCFTEMIDVKHASSVVYDADRLMNWLVKHNVKLLLHGHKHRSFVSRVQYPVDNSADISNDKMKVVTVIGMGGTGADGADNKFATIRFEDHEVIVEFYRIYSDESADDAKCQTLTLPL